MTDEPDGRPVPVDLTALAELDAGLPDPEEAARLRAAAGADPRAAAVLDALAATRAELAGLRTPEVPDAVAARWSAALAAESPPAGRSPARSRSPGAGGGPRRSLPLRPLVAAAAVVVVAVVGAGLAGLLGRPEAAVPAVGRVELVALGREAVGTMDVGELADPARRASCLRAVAPDAVGESLLGGRRVVVDGRPGVLLVLATGTRGGLDIVAVDPTCGASGGALIARLLVG